MKILTGLLAMLLPILSGAQSPPVRALNPGDELTEMPFVSIINYTDSTASLNNFSNELVILDFWATWCAPCVKALPGLQELQNQFGDRVQFVLTTSEEKDIIKKFLHNKKIMLPSFVGDKKHQEYFPHNSVPHEVWIHKGKVIAITYAEEVTSENIQKVLDGKQVNLTLKKSNFEYNINEPLLVGGNGGSADDLLYHSVITGFLDGILGGGVLTDSLNRLRSRVINGNVAELYSTAASLQDINFSIANRTIIEANNKEKIRPIGEPQYMPSLRKFYYCYELAIPAASKTNVGALMMEDLNRYFGMVYQIKGVIEKRRVLCWVLRKGDNPVTIYTKNSTPSIKNEGGYEFWTNKSFSSFFYTLAYIHKNEPHPFVDKTGINGNVDVEFPFDFKDVATLQSYLKNLGFSLSLEDTEIPMLVIQNNNN